MKPILEIKNISKKYKLRGQESPYLTFRDALTSGFKQNKSKDEFWALNDVSFDVYPGESIGIIGRNGAGKSTLLKILSRITPPTSGEIISRGRIASLLEVGTGFHAELSGRENIFLNGSILGLSKKEITKQFDAIVDFSGVEKFLDTPLKHYSSGMQLRLAFAVAAHLEPEILIIDEVLAVGDAEFQQKCIGKMDEVGKNGRTLIFVSHNLDAINRLCKNVCLLDSGQNIYIGDKNKGLEIYSSTHTESTYISKQLKTSGIFLKHAWFSTREGLKTDKFLNGEPVTLNLQINNPQEIKFYLHLAFFDHLKRVLWVFDEEQYNNLQPLAISENKIISLTFYPPFTNSQNINLDIAFVSVDNSIKHEHLINFISYNILEQEARKYNQFAPFYCNVDYKENTI